MRALVVLFLVALAAPAAAQPADVPALIKLIENQPNDMDRSTWKEKRRDAARRLAQSKDKRAVPVLINLAESETFDIIGDIAIEGLGTLRDASAVPVLQRIVGDASRDKSSRELARKSLARLGAPETGAGSAAGGATGATGGATGSGTAGATGGGGPTNGAKTGGGATGGGASGGAAKTGGGGTASGGTKTGGGTTGGSSGGTTGGATTGSTGTGATSTTSDGTATDAPGGTVTADVSSGDTGLEGGGAVGGDSGGGLLGGTSSDVDGLPELADDVIAAYDRLTFAAGTAGFSYDSARSRVDFDANASGRYQKRIEAESRAFGLDIGADLVAGVVNPEGRGVTRGLVLDVHGDGEARFYSGKLYGIGKAAVGVGFQQFSFRHPMDPAQDTVGADARALTADLQIALGGGYGRIVDVGAAIRVQRLGKLLDDARALGKPIDAATARRLQLTWWALRGERSSFRALIATIAILREAGILLGEPNAVITYEILTVLRDTQLYLRPTGFDVHLLFGEGYLKRPDSDDDGTCDIGAYRCGRVEQVLLNAAYAQQVDDNKLELSGSAYARYRLFSPDGNPTPWAAGASAGMRRFFYGEHGDPFGALDLRGGVMLSADNSQMDPCTGGGCDVSLRIEGELGFTYWLNQASGLRLAATVAEDGGDIFIGARLQATYGLLDGTFAR